MYVYDEIIQGYSRLGQLRLCPAGGQLLAAADQKVGGRTRQLVLWHARQVQKS
jgi:hypothetical protein